MALLNVALLATAFLGRFVAGANPTDYVNNFIGTNTGGHVFAGATLPFGSVKAVADCDSGDNQGGFVTDGSPIRGISQLHDDGTGGGSSLGNFKLLPEYCTSLSTCKTDEYSRTVARVSGSEVGHPGYFGISLASGIKTEVTVTQHAALHRFTYTNSTASNSSAVLLFDLTNDLSHSFGGDGTLSISAIDSKPSGHVRVQGGGRFNPSFGTGSYMVYFCLDTSGVQGAAYYLGSQTYTLTGAQTIAVNSDTYNAGVLFSYGRRLNNSASFARVGISWTSAAKACTYAEQEIPAYDNVAFEHVRAAATATWDSTLGTVKVDTTGVSNDATVLFWSSLYRSYISPTNITGDNPLWSSTEPYYDSYYCIWDSYRVVHPLYTITQRAAQAEIVRAIIDVYRHEGFLPDCRMSLDKGYTQGGSNADNLLAESYVKGITAGINWQDGLNGMIKDATVTPSDWAYEGRGGIANRKKLGYVPVDDDTPGGILARSASRTLEYAFNDFGIALVANGLKQTNLVNQYVNASADWYHLWNNKTSNSGYSGFIQPRHVDGSWLDVDPRFCSPVLGHTSCYLNDGGGEFYEASSWEYSYFVPHDMEKLVGLMGGKSTYISRLDTFFSAGFHDIGDEPGFLPCFLYNYAGRPDKTVDRVLSVLRSNYNTTNGGLPGNDDSGAMGGFAVFSSFGFYPVAGTSVYLLSTPLFPTITFPSSAGSANPAILKTTNFDGANKNRYIVSATLNGQPFTRNWFSHGEFFGKGGVLQLTLGPSPSSWGTATGDLPPSLSSSSIDKFA